MAHDLPDFVVGGEQARLVPVLADTSKEGRAASVALACLAAVPEFGRSMLSTVGQRVGSRAQMACFTEVVLSNGEGRRDRPDGLIVVTTGKRRWSALVEAKIGNSSLDDEQVARYVALAKANGVDALITISNQFSAVPTHHPVKLPKNQLRKFGLFHWSWLSLITRARVILDVEQSLDVDQRFILEETVRFLDHPTAGTKHFDQMNSEWRDVVKGVQRGTRWGRSAPEIESTVGAWHQKQRDLSLQLTQKLSTPVSIGLSRAHVNAPEKRLREDSADFIKNGRLSASFEVPDLASPVEVVADAATRLVSCSVRLKAPQDRKTTKARANWLIRQLGKTPESEVFINAYWPYRQAPLEISLSEARSDPGLFSQGDAKSSVSSFEVKMMRDFAGRFSGSRTFIEDLECLVPEFYRNVAQHLRAWVPEPPKLKDGDAKAGEGIAQEKISASTELERE